MWDTPGAGEGEFDALGFGGVAIDGHANLFVVDNGNFRIQKFDRDGNYVTQWGGEGFDDGQFQQAIGIAVDSSGNVYVTDDGRPEIQVFDKNGEFIRKWGTVGSGDGEFEHPTGIAVDPVGNVYVADYETNESRSSMRAAGSCRPGRWSPRRARRRASQSIVVGASMSPTTTGDEWRFAAATVS